MGRSHSSESVPVRARGVPTFLPSYLPIYIIQYNIIYRLFARCEPEGRLSVSVSLPRVHPPPLSHLGTRKTSKAPRFQGIDCLLITLSAALPAHGCARAHARVGGARHGWEGTCGAQGSVLPTWATMRRGMAARLHDAHAGTCLLLCSFAGHVRVTRQHKTDFVPRNIPLMDRA